MIKIELHFKLYPLVIDLLVLSEILYSSRPALPTGVHHSIKHTLLNTSFTVQDAIQAKWQGSNMLLAEATSQKKDKR